MDDLSLGREAVHGYDSFVPPGVPLPYGTSLVLTHRAQEFHRVSTCDAPDGSGGRFGRLCSRSVNHMQFEADCRLSSSYVLMG